MDFAPQKLRTLRTFGWLIHPTKCVGTSTAESAFVALSTLVDLATQTYAVPPATLARILHGFTALLTGPPSVGVRTIEGPCGIHVAGDEHNAGRFYRPGPFCNGRCHLTTHLRVKHRMRYRDIACDIVCWNGTYDIVGQDTTSYVEIRHRRSGYDIVCQDTTS